MFTIVQRNYELCLGVIVAHNQTSIVPVEAIGDKHMHTDPKSVGKIRWMPDNPERKALKNGWFSHDGRVLHIAGNMSLLFTLFTLTYSMNMRTTIMMVMVISSYSYMICTRLFYLLITQSRERISHKSDPVG